MPLMFLSTPPSRVATAVFCGVRYTCRIVSIHATLAGGDVKTGKVIMFLLRFYPRHPRGWRPISSLLPLVTALFLSTPPSRVATWDFGY